MQDMGAGRDLGECCGSVETRFGLGWRANWCSDHPLGALSYIFSGQKKKRSLLWNPTRHKKYPKSCRVVGPRCQVYLGFIVRRA